ncbi:hypothetical protein TNCT_106151 [Trichonephila clavata]|uniref:Uncharacterized protein n=1 Tax=Trichonephila clavata TaxID=2740835 RepID=A0A8X6HNX6_TRICU|nr:hypothetical protein TNCT_106151 [Trichonephila clavata]
MFETAQADRVITPEMIAEVNTLVLDNRRITVNEIYQLLDVSVGATHTLMHQHLLSKNLFAVGSSPTDRRTAQYSNGAVFESSATLS